MTAKAALQSMTGFARTQGADDRVSWTWELRSVNSRGLDQRYRLPSGWEALEPEIRALAGETLSRGSLQANLTTKAGKAPAKLTINRAVLDQLVAITKELETEVPAAPARLDGLLSLRGVLEESEDEESEEQQVTRRAAVRADFSRALAALAEMRGQEGARLQTLLQAHLERIAELEAAARACAATQPAAIKARLKALLAELLEAEPALPEERLAQEAALLVGKADVREELDRLAAHIAGSRELLAEGGPVGRRLDFLCQEFNREANTLCSKSSDVELTRIGLELKGAIEQLREQVQNLE
ncbi:YicC/YloC family endoribonuclease [Algihabitans albus]|uniref:YicC/YloC family endoribonuclease n=1 Tax=Algihabitans albus TaxID=2164067 RepID=UPI001F265122|nr:YicC/YloC family endoribonuclease [Algihabitans albus]